ncbi:predicted protein [Naegleria gruberi]|uniref:Predicted protein n=1 Tax=Naegleria gruberi TaxID=5762 RepID=D2VWB8_NAEGR|nr:uncharacterized protein NAEGRDRAFT_73326 [Naegleria gruberi]EFC38872.1 predicted protein [Naegleria gruberi]|eukprot:XP_002671616.1 predicted protein [Naegleria gruberi strain NEG-M]
MGNTINSQTGSPSHAITDLSKINSSGLVASNHAFYHHSSPNSSNRSSMSSSDQYHFQNNFVSNNNGNLGSGHLEVSSQFLHQLSPSMMEYYNQYQWNGGNLFTDDHEDYDLIVDMDDPSPHHLTHKGWSIKLSTELELRILDRIRESMNQAAALAHQEQNEHIYHSIQNQMTQNSNHSYINTQAIIPGVLPTASAIQNAPSRPPSPSFACGGLPSNNTATDHSDLSSASDGELTPRDSNVDDPFSSTANPSNSSRKKHRNRRDHHYINYFAEIEHKFTQQPSCVVSVLGFKNSGKTHLLNELSGSDLRVGLTQSTPALCFKVPKNNQGRDWLLVDTMGLRGAVRVADVKRQLREIQKEGMVPTSDEIIVHENQQLTASKKMPTTPLSSTSTQQQMWIDPEIIQQQQWNEAIKRNVREKRMLEDTIEEVLLNMSHFILYVVNEMTWEEHEKLYDLLNRRDTGINPTTGKPRKITVVVVHNFKECETLEDFNKMVQRYVVDAFPGELRSKEVNIVNGSSSNGQNITVGFAPFFTSGSGNRVINHVFLAKKDSEVGQKYNQLTYALIRIWLASQSTERIHCMTSYLTSHIQAALQNHITNIKDVQMNFKIKKSVLDENSLNNSITQILNSTQPSLSITSSHQNSSMSGGSSSSSGGGLLSSWSSMIRGSDKKSTNPAQVLVPPSIGEFILKFLPEDDCQLQYSSESEFNNGSNSNVVGMYTGGHKNDKQ